MRTVQLQWSEAKTWSTQSWAGSVADFQTEILSVHVFSKKQKRFHYFSCSCFVLSKPEFFSFYRAARGMLAWLRTAHLDVVQRVELHEVMQLSESFVGILEVKGGVWAFWVVEDVKVSKLLFYFSVSRNSCRARSPKRSEHTLINQTVKSLYSDSFWKRF